MFDQVALNVVNKGGATPISTENHGSTGRIVPMVLGILVRLFRTARLMYLFFVMSECQLVEKIR